MSGLGPYPLDSEAVEWKLAIASYLKDDLEAAWQFVERLGSGNAGRYLRWERSIEAEWITRQRSQTVTVSPSLQIEAIAEEVGEALPFATQLIVEAANHVAHRLRWSYPKPILVSILASETDAPWTSGRHGFCTAKVPFAKICLPARIVGEPQELVEAMRHETTHAITNERTAARIPRWLDEAFAETYGGVPKFRPPHAPWLDPEALNQVFLQNDQSNPTALYGAYLQSAQIGRFLFKQQGDEGMRSLLDAFGNIPRWREFLIATRFGTYDDAALKKVFGISTKELFEAARSGT